MRKIFFLNLLILFSTSTLALYEPEWPGDNQLPIEIVDNRKSSLQAKTMTWKAPNLRVIAPNVISVAINQYDQDTFAYIVPAYADFMDMRNKKCPDETAFTRTINLWVNSFKEIPLHLDARVKHICRYISKITDGADNLSIKIIDWNLLNNNTPFYKAFIYVDDVEITKHLVLKGLIKADYKLARMPDLVLAEKKARCQRVGIWKVYEGDYFEDKACQPSLSFGE